MDNRFGMVGRMMNFFRMMNLFGSNKKFLMKRYLLSDVYKKMLEFAIGTI